MTWPSRVRSRTWWSTFGVADFIRVPSPAARTTTAAGGGGLTLAGLLACAVAEAGKTASRRGYGSGCNLAPQSRLLHALRCLDSNQYRRSPKDRMLRVAPQRITQQGDPSAG